MDTSQASITIRLPKWMRDQIKSEARAEDLTASQLIRRHLTAKFPQAKPTARRPRKEVSLS